MTGQDTASGGDSAAQPEGNAQSEWDALPDPVCARLADVAAAAVGELPRSDIPQRLRPIARFAPAKRARRGASALLAELRDSPVFRAAVVRWWEEHDAAALDPEAQEPAAAAAAALLHGRSDAAEWVRRVAEQAEQSTLRAERDSAIARASRLEAEVEQLRAELAEARADVERARAERADEVERLRGRLREQGVRLREARDAAKDGEHAAERVRAELEEELSALRGERDAERGRAEQERARAERAGAEAEVAKQSAREARDADEVRLRLLLDTLDGATAGLRRELTLGSSGTGAHPADRVRGAGAGGGGRTWVNDAVGLDRVLALPNAHLVVDGYNVTKTGYPELTLADQRDRLVRQLAVLAARTRVEVTVVFDGAGVVAVPSAAPKGVRVLFSDPGVSADDVIVRLADGEPQGRPLAVATSDRAVAEAARRRGAYPVPSDVLLVRIGKV